MKRIVLFAGLLVATPLSAQEDSLLASAVQLATEGQGDSARALVRGRLAELSPADSLYPEALYTAGVVSDDLAIALHYLRRVSIEYAGSAWADRALLRLGQLTYASGDVAGALRAAERILTDYPFSDIRTEAKFWVGRAQLELGQADQGCRRLLEARAEAAADVELAHRADYHLLRCAGIGLAGDSAAADAAAREPPAPPGPTVYSVQVAAVRSAAAADEVMRTLHASGYQPRVVQDTDGLLKVRVGRYRAREEAQALAAELRRRFGGSAFVVEER
jgi:hypothetical protein